MIRELKDLETINYYLSKFNQTINTLDDPFKKYIVYEVDNIVASFLNYSLIYDRIEIEYIYTNPEYRNQNIASKLLDYITLEGQKYKCLNITLEVRKSNVIACNFYKKNGFVEVSIRKNYYDKEDAILMLKELLK